MWTGDINEIYDILYRLGVTANYAGFFHTSYAVTLAVQQPERLLVVTKWLYPDVARQYDTNWSCVERNIRTAAADCPSRQWPLLEKLARRSLPRRPTASQFLAILTAHLIGTSAA